MYTLVVDRAIYSRHKTLAAARKAGDRLANAGYTVPLEIWRNKDLNAVLDEQDRGSASFNSMSYSQAVAKRLGLEPLEYWED